MVQLKSDVKLGGENCSATGNIRRVAEIEGQRKIGSTFSNAFKATTRLIVISNF